MFESVRPDQAGRDVLVMEILDEAAGRLDEGLADSPEVRGFLHHTLGHSYLLLGKYDESIAHLERAVALKEEIGAEIEDVIEARADLASALGEVGRVEDAESILRDAIDRLGDLPDHSALLEAKLHGTLGGAAASRSDYLTAEPSLEAAYRLRSATAGGDPMETAAILNNLGMVKEMLAKYEEAAELYRAGLELMAGDQRDHVFARAHLLHNLANLESKIGDHDEAERLFRESLVMTRELYGPRHPGVASTLETLGALLEDMGRLDEADVALAESLSIREEMLPAGHLKIASTIATLGELRLAQRRYEESETLSRKARAMRAEQLGEPHWLVGKADVRISRALLRQGRFAEAHETAWRAYETMRTDRDYVLAMRLGAVEQLCELYEQWPEPDPEAPRRLSELIAAQRELDDGEDLAERLERCLEQVRVRLDGAADPEPR